jgi:putative heme-binding domain-containing protein
VPLLLEALGNGRDRELRKAAVVGLAQTADGARELLNLARDGKLDPDVKPVAAAELDRARWPELKAEAAKVLPLSAGRAAQTWPSRTELAKMAGDVVIGEKIFFRQIPGCYNCHTVRGKGAQVGPDLSEIGSKLGKDAIIEAILDPSAGISVGYETYSLELQSGDEAYGLLVSDSKDEVAIKDLKGIVTRYRKSEIVSRRQLKTSIMPTGLQDSLSQPEFVDLVEFLFSLKKL